MSPHLHLEDDQQLFQTRLPGEVLVSFVTTAGAFETAKDKPFAQLATSAGLNRPLQIKYKDLEAVVTARVSYPDFPLEIRQDFIRITDQQVLVPITVMLSNARLAFTQSSGTCRASIRIYGRVVTLGNRIEAIFEDEVGREFPAADMENARLRSSVYQKRLILKPGLYKLEIAIKDDGSKHIGMAETRLQVPRFDEGKLSLSSIVLAERIEAGSRDLSSSSFLLGDIKVIPKTDNVYRKSGDLGLYVQIYNFAVEERTQRPAIKMEYGIAPKGSEPEVWRDVSASLQFAGQYCRLARMINLSRLQPGPHILHIRVKDRISAQTTEAQASFALSN